MCLLRLHATRTGRKELLEHHVVFSIHRVEGVHDVVFSFHRVGGGGCTVFLWLEYNIEMHVCFPPSSIQCSLYVLCTYEYCTVHVCLYM